MNVLSLFDGMSCAQLALNRAKMKPAKYYASEVDKYAIKVTQKNFPETIQVGDVTEIKAKDFKNITLLVAGSPCQGFSFAGKQLNFNDERSKLFFEFVRILNEVKPKYFLLENVKMKKEYQDLISKYAGVEPIEINSALVSAQNRKRLYWTNIPGVDQPKEIDIKLKDVLLTNGNPVCYSTSGRGNGIVEARISSNEKAHTLTGAGYSHRSFSGVIEKLKHSDKALCYMNRKIKDGRNHWDFGYIQDLSREKGKCLTANLHKGVPYNVLVDCIPKEDEIPRTFRKLHPIECERLQTVPDNYTEGVSNTQRYKMLGNGFTVEVITHILKKMKNEC